MNLNSNSHMYLLPITLAVFLDLPFKVTPSSLIFFLKHCLYHILPGRRQLAWVYIALDADKERVTASLCTRQKGILSAKSENWWEKTALHSQRAWQKEVCNKTNDLILPGCYWFHWRCSQSHHCWHHQDVDIVKAPKVYSIGYTH